MSLFIKGMIMPWNCVECPLYKEFAPIKAKYCAVAPRITISTHSRPKGCPLHFVRKHNTQKGEAE